MIPRPSPWPSTRLARQLAWLRAVIKIGAIAGLSSVILVMLLGQPRIFYTMSKDGLLPPVFSAVHPKFRTPWIAQILTGAIAMLVAGLFPIGLLGELVSIGTLLAFAIVCAGVFVLRFTDPQIHAAVPHAGVLAGRAAGRDFLRLSDVWPAADTWARLIVWMAIGLVIYFTYGRRHSKLQRQAARAGRIEIWLPRGTWPFPDHPSLADAATALIF